MIRKKNYTRHYTRVTVTGDPAERQYADIYEVYTQPRSDYVRARLYELWYDFLWKTRIEKLQDKLWVWYLQITGNEERYHSLHSMVEIPGVRHDLKMYDLDHKNETVLGEVETKREDAS